MRPTGRSTSITSRDSVTRTIPAGPCSTIRFAKLEVIVLKLNGSLIAGAVITVFALYYWVAVRGSVSQIPLIYIFTFRMFPFADVLWTAAGVGALYKGIIEYKESND